MSNMKTIRSKLHTFISLYIVFGGAISNNCVFLKIHCITLMIIIFHWLTNNNNCFLSQYDHHQDKTGYTRSVLKKYFGINISDEDQIKGNIISYFAAIIPLLYTYRKIKQYK